MDYSTETLLVACSPIATVLSTDPRLQLAFFGVNAAFDRSTMIFCYAASLYFLRDLWWDSRLSGRKSRVVLGIVGPPGPQPPSDCRMAPSWPLWFIYSTLQKPTYSWLFMECWANYTLTTPRPTCVALHHSRCCCGYVDHATIWWHPSSERIARCLDAIKFTMP